MSDDINANHQRPCPCYLGLKQTTAHSMIECGMHKDFLPLDNWVCDHHVTLRKELEKQQKDHMDNCEPITCINYSAAKCPTCKGSGRA